jgi:ATP-dependent RNA helicase DeaD
VHGVKPGNIVGAIANESGLDGKHIGSIEIEAEYSLVDLPAGMPKDIFNDLKKVRICGQAMGISLHGEGKAPRKQKGQPNPKAKSRGKPKLKSKAKGKSKPASRKGKPGKRSSSGP